MRGFQPLFFLWNPALDPACHPFFKILFLLVSFLFHPLLRCFRQFPHPHATSSCPNPTHQPFLHIIGLNKYKKFGCTSSNVTLYQKSIFHFLNPCGIFSGQLRITFFIKLWFFFKCITQSGKE